MGEDSIWEQNLADGCMMCHLIEIMSLFFLFLFFLGLTPVLRASSRLCSGADPDTIKTLL